ncbi:MAG: hypothetical protein HYS22_04000 [Deltaproteobacteria bacterium]|nr:hypothetical protein [Deltaproteobacteria bacterium]
MRFQKTLLAVALVISSLGVATHAGAGELENGNKDRKGFLIGFGLGGGMLHTRGGGATDTRADFLGDFKIGGGVTEDILLMYDGSFIYTKDGNVNFSIYNSSFAVQWFPVSNFYIRPGVGFSVSTASASASGVTVSASSDVSFGADFAAGYEFRLGKRFALSPEFIYHFSDIRSSGASLQAHSMGAQASLLWYF